MYKEVVVHVYGGILLVIKNASESVLMRWMNLEPVIQSEISQKEKNKYRILIHMKFRRMVPNLRAGIETQTQRADSGHSRIGEGGMN